MTITSFLNSTWGRVDLWEELVELWIPKWMTFVEIILCSSSGMRFQLILFTRGNISKWFGPWNPSRFGATTDLEDIFLPFIQGLLLKSEASRTIKNNSSAFYTQTSFGNIWFQTTYLVEPHKPASSYGKPRILHNKHHWLRNFGSGFRIRSERINILKWKHNNIEFT